MRAGPRTRLLLHLHDAVFVVLFLVAVGLLAWLSQRYAVRVDVSSAGRNSLSAPSTALLERIDGPVTVVAYVRPDPLRRRAVADFVARFQRARPGIELRFVDPDRVPDEVRRLGISGDGELLVEHRGAREHVLELTEQAFVNALHRASRAGRRWVAYLRGHGERDLEGRRNHDLGTFGAELEARGFVVQGLDPVVAGGVPDNTTVLVVTQPQVDLPPEVAQAVLEHLRHGGNMLWLTDPGPLHGLEPVAAELGVHFEEGVVVDPSTRYPEVALVSSYATHPITRGFDRDTYFPVAAAITWEQPPGWKTTGVLGTGLRAWVERDALAGEARYDAGRDLAGPFDIGVAMERSVGEGDAARVQRVAVLGDGDFLSNTYLGNGGNLDLGMNLFNWLAADDVLVDVPARVGPDLDFAPGQVARVVIALGPPVVLPLALLGMGLAMWRRRNR